MSNNARRYTNRKEAKVAGTSPHQPKPKWEDDRQERSQSKRIQPKTNKQKLYQHMLEQMTLVVADGPAGVGKTLLPCNHAATLMLAKKIEQIVLVRPYAATGGKTMGYNKGSFSLTKSYPFMLPMIGYIKDVLGAPTVDIMMQDGRILIQPLETIRGQSFKNAYMSLRMKCKVQRLLKSKH
jgi:phosphate starvation-inducible protein PhoH